VTDFAAVCEALTILPPETRRRIVEEALASGYAAKDLAELMGVSPPAVSRYTRGDLAPSVGAICRLLMNAEEELANRLLVLAARGIWAYLRLLIENLPPGHALEELLSEIADYVSEKLATYHIEQASP